MAYQYFLLTHPTVQSLPAGNEVAGITVAGSSNVMVPSSVVSSSPLWGFSSTVAVSYFKNCTMTATPISSPSESELLSTAPYKEVEEALSELHNLEDGEHWKMDDEVFNTSVQVAAALSERNVAAPGIFSHGPKSVVFTWSRAGDNLYLTVSARHFSVLISSMEGVQYRADIESSQVTGRYISALGSLRPARQLEFVPSTDTSVASR
jgi:hypothetical protein